MAKMEILLPSMGEGVIEATITKFLVNIGDHVEEDDSLVEVATDKVDSEIPAPEAGTIKELILKEGDIPKVGELLLIMETEGEEPEPNRPEVLKEVEKVTFDPVAEETISQEVQEAQEALQATSGTNSRTPSGKFLSPLVRKMIKEEGISIDKLDEIQGSGSHGRITKADIMQLLDGQESEYSAQQGASDPVLQANSKKSITEPVPDISQKPIPAGANEEIVEMDRMRQLIAEHMVHSKKTSPHVTSFVEADVSDLVRWRNKVKDEFLKKENQKITFTPLFIEAASKALRDFPMVNVSVDGSNIIVKRNINIGMATALPSGNLIVPVIKNADEKNLLGLAKSVNDLANRARGNKLKPDEITGGTFTITNFGSFQNLTGTPIINQPEAAILGVGAIVKKPAVIETPMGDSIGIRHKMILSLSYDHRVVDGALGGMFLKRIADYLEQFDIERTV
ncbi:MAG: dihydrolipoamide acetyltransferase family protein [Bacteroidota bacterium]|nr:dihydrolipoamide acetyltransferase family protein [Bacteroidota bacterium]